jgi:hypothetical protein
MAQASRLCQLKDISEMDKLDNELNAVEGIQTQKMIFAD